MTIIIIVFGTLTLLAGIIIVINPEVVFGFLRDMLDKPWLHITAVVVRLVLGALLIQQSGISRFPLVIEVLGWLSITAAIIMALMGRRKFIRLMTWALSLSRPLGHAGGVLAMAFGAFLVFSFIR
jgi:hypothetical protein